MLYELSRSTLLFNLDQFPGPQLTQLIQFSFSVEGVAIFDSNSGQRDRAGTWSEGGADLAKECFLLHNDGEDSMTRTTRRQLRIGANALASLAAITLDRCVSFDKESRIAAAHQSERLRAAALDSLAHAVKTPLTAIQSANAGLREVGALNSPQKELASLVEEESNQLGQLCNRLLQTARLEVIWSQALASANRP